MQLLRLRYFQLKRDLGFWVAIIGAAAFYLCYEVSSLSSRHSFIFTLSVAAALGSYQLNRRDLSFVSHYLNRPRLQILANYHLLLLPLSLALLVTGNWPHALLLHALATGIPLLQFKPRSQKFLFISRYIPAAQFEWISGLRKNLYFIIPLLLIALVLSPVKFFGLLALFLLNAIFLNFYNACEPLVMLNPHNLRPEEFLRQKVNYILKILLLINGPLLLVNSIFHPESAWFCFCFLLAFLLLAACTVYIKYANYRPNEPLGFHADYLVLFGSILFPYGLPLSLYLYYSKRKKAIAHLSRYQHDQH